jgi:hypothetical protein
MTSQFYSLPLVVVVEAIGKKCSLGGEIIAKLSGSHGDFIA